MRSVFEKDQTSRRLVASSPLSVRRILGLLEILAHHPEGNSLSQLSATLDSPKSSLLILLRPFVTEGYLLRYEDLYLLGPLTYRLAARILNTRRLPRLVRPFLDALAEQTEETVYLATLDLSIKKAVFIDMVAGAKAIGFAMPVGFVRPLYATAAGRLLLAYQDETWKEDYLSSTELTPLTPHTTIDANAIRRDLIAIRKNGMAISIDEAVDGGSAIAAPIFGPTGEVEAAFVVAAPTSRLRKQLSTFQQALLEAAAAASGSERPTAAAFRRGWPTR